MDHPRIYILLLVLFCQVVSGTHTRILTSLANNNNLAFWTPKIEKPGTVYKHDDNKLVESQDLFKKDVQLFPRQKVKQMYEQIQEMLKGQHPIPASQPVPQQHVSPSVKPSLRPPSEPVVQPPSEPVVQPTQPIVKPQKHQVRPQQQHGVQPQPFETKKPSQPVNNNKPQQHDELNNVSKQSQKPQGEKPCRSQSQDDYQIEFYRIRLTFPKQLFTQIFVVTASIVIFITFILFRDFSNRNRSQQNMYGLGGNDESAPISGMFSTRNKGTRISSEEEADSIGNKLYA